MLDSPTRAPKTPSQAPQADNVRRCPVLSGPTDLPEHTDPSPDNQTTCAQNPFSPDQTSTGHPPLPAPEASATVCEPQAEATSLPSSAASALTGGTSEPKVEAASRPIVSASVVDSPTPAPKTPSQAPQADNVRKCPVLSGPTDLPEQTDLSVDKQTTCDPNASYPTRHSPASTPPTPTTQSPNRPLPNRTGQPREDPSIASSPSLLRGEKENSQFARAVQHAPNATSSRRALPPALRRSTRSGRGGD